MESSTAGSPCLDGASQPNKSFYPQDNLSTLRSPSPPPSQHRRGYQACDPCRKRKVKCDLGSVDNPRPPPCVRCRRESKRCEFSATRRKRKPSDVAERDHALHRDKRMMIGETTYSSSPEIPGLPYPSSSMPLDNNGGPSQAQWPETSSTPSQMPRSTTKVEYTSQNVSSMEPHQEVRNIRGSNYGGSGRASGSGFALESGQHMMNKTAAELLSPTISNSHDALHLLSEAAGRTEDLNRQSLESRLAARQSISSFATTSNSHVTQADTLKQGRQSFSRPSRSGAVDGYYQVNRSGSIDPHMPEIRNQPNSADAQDSGYLDAVKAWSRLRFVRAGWLTVEEAMAYIAYYYKHLAPLSPIVIPDFSPPSTHRTLLTEEPVLAVTMLTTASRHMRPKGDGAYTRAYYIHDRLWSYLRGMIERLFWGQEKFGGSAIGMNQPRSIDLAPLPGMVNLSGHLRSLGTVEALLILTDWHPRNLHFPPGDDENTLLDMDAHIPSQIRSDRDGEHDVEPIASRTQGSNPEGRLAFQKWLEPTWRSDRMSWMLLSTAQALAFELGVFDQKNGSGNGNEPIAEQVRKRRVRRLILVYVTQSSGRLGIPSMLPLPQWGHDVGPTHIGHTAADNGLIDRMQDCWIGISKIMYESNQILFASKEQTSELIRSGRYRKRIAEFLPSLREFRRNLDSIPLSSQMRNILTIEYEYTRLYVNCLALQAVVDRWTTMTNETSAAQTQGGHSGSASSSGTTSLRVLMQLYRDNEMYIQEVVDASRKILQTVLDGLVPGDHLKHCPVRTFFRILSGMIFILKTFTLGATEDDVRVSLALQDKTIEALRTCVVDDVHLSNTISRLLELLTANIRTRFLRFAQMDRADNDAQDRASPPRCMDQSPRPRDGSGAQWQQSQNAAPSLGYSVDGTHGSNQANAPATVASCHDPLASIPAKPINSSNINASFMPPPSAYYNYFDQNATTPAGDQSPTIQSIQDGPGASSSALPDWFALPLDQFFNSSMDQGLGVTGAIVSEFDMLEVLLDECDRGEKVDRAGHSPSSI
ncbi:hypothetical protein Egran_03713 [Elaphomyces granulatus]|uniref:Zn(2)-C6 fungal-type domain-containing protein n=1 Tax=Elaphomyces granulatus TaxID=519963 RepID=A0A232LXH8_9EURO|nr:hypothetical protein Egran_03713 [Elaphomyces granulatus]